VKGCNVARLPRFSSIETREARRRLAVQKRSYRRQITVGVFLAYAKGARRGAWIARWRDGRDYREQRIGAADDFVDADGSVVLSYSQAVKAAIALAAGSGKVVPRYFGDGMRVGDAIDAYLTWRGEDRPNSSTNATDLHALNRHVRPKFGDRAIASISGAELRDWLQALAKAPPTERAPNGGRRRRSGIDMKDPDVRRRRRLSANRVWNAFRAALNHAWRDERNGIESDVAWRRVKPLDVEETGPPRMLEPDEVTRLLNAAQGSFRDLLHAALFTGARYGELVTLRCADFLFDQQAIVIRQGKTGKVLVQPLTTEGVKFFERLTAGRERSAWILERAAGVPWSKSDQARPMQEAATNAKVDDVSFKVTRATYGKLLLIATKDIELVARALGHSDSRITRKHYAQYLPNEVAEGVRKMAPLGIDPSNVAPLRIGTAKRKHRRVPGG